LSKKSHFCNLQETEGYPQQISTAMMRFSLIEVRWFRVLVEEGSDAPNGRCQSVLESTVRNTEKNLRFHFLDLFKKVSQ
jgi:hypothetical protein